jgi:endonuclease YncB( thermonuclease family)
MKAALLLALALACAPVPAHAQTYVGQAVAVDGDTLDMTGQRVRLFGVDAVELGQTCDRAGPDGAEAWRCGEDARAQLGELVAGKMVACETRDVDVYGRVVAVCRAGRVDLSQAMAWAGFAVALEDFSRAYVPAVEAARAQRTGIWASEFAEPGAWRAANPGEQPPVRAVRREADDAVHPAARPAAAVRAGVYYRNCDAARAAGAAPLYRGQPGYRPEMDGDSDGIACEPYRGRR